jgi:hypothetical protein
MEYVRIFSDAASESHFGTGAVDLTLADYAPPAPPVYLGAHNPATRFAFVQLSGGWYGEPHPTPRRRMLLILTGLWEMTVSDGEVRRFPAGSAVLLEDTSGQGHTTRILGDEDSHPAIVHVPEGHPLHQSRPRSAVDKELMVKYSCFTWKYVRGRHRRDT